MLMIMMMIMIVMITSPPSPRFIGGAWWRGVTRGGADGGGRAVPSSPFRLLPSSSPPFLGDSAACGGGEGEWEGTAVLSDPSSLSCHDYDYNYDYD